MEAYMSNYPDGADNDPNAPWKRKSTETVRFNWRGFNLDLEVEPCDYGQKAPQVVVEAVWLDGKNITELIGDELATLDGDYNKIARDEWMAASSGC
jgi:hypothetical protein